MCKNRVGQLLGLSLLALVLTACGQKGDLFLPENEVTKKKVLEKEAPAEQDPKDGPIMKTEPQESLDTEQQPEQEPKQKLAEPQGEQP